MTLDEAISRACADVGVIPPKRTDFGRWLTADTTSGRNGKGDGRLVINAEHVTAWNWQSGEKSTVHLGDALSPSQRRRAVAAQDEARRQEAVRRREAARVAVALVAAATSRPGHPYLAAKSFADEPVLVTPAAAVRSLVGAYAVPPSGRAAIVIPIRRGLTITSAQLIWEDGTKKFLFGGEFGGGFHRIASGTETWLCEGYATGLSLRLALRGLSRSASVLCCLSASNIATVARSVRGRCYIAADRDKPQGQFDGRGTGEHWAIVAGKPFVMPSAKDFNDMHVADGIFAVQRDLATFLRGVPM